MNKTILLILGMLTFLNSQSNAPTLIPMTDKATYDYIEYLNIAGVIDIEFSGSKPYRSDEIYTKLLKITEPKAITKNFIERFKEEYIQTDNRFGKVESKNTTGWFDPYVNLSYVSQNALEKPLYIKFNTYNYLLSSQADRGYKYPDISQNITDGGIKAYFGYKEFLSLSTNSGVMIKHSYEFKMRDEYEVLNLVPSGGEADFSSEDHTETALLLSGEDISFSIGKYPLSLGAGNMHSLTLSSQKAYYENFIFSIASDRVKFSTVTGFLLADSQTRSENADPYYIITNADTTSRASDYFKREKYLSAHRLEWRALDNLSFGVNEMVIMGDRTIEMGYMLPILPLFWMGHYYGDHDNSLISFDLKYKPFKNFSFFSEILFDDETFTESWTKNYMNKWAVSAGLTNTNFLTVEGLTFDFEYARVEPYVYGHKYHINRYMNLDYFMGMPAGPDSETLNYRLKYFYDFDKNITIGYSRANRGEPLWGRWDAPSYAVANKVFLRGTVEKNNYYYVDVELRYNKYISMNLFYSHTDIINYNHNLPRYDETWLEDYSSVEDYYTKEIEPTKVKQVYSNNTFAIKLNFVIKNYFKSIFK
ncbi:MAG: hypothetical protein PF638_15025 [Candidatus Delongbacteria bacterium]|jgi:hypothetical protein|nr:hypothetical protein [Candidatus Delongbacteria bacterium]